MIKIEYREKTIHVPQSWDDVKLKDYETYYQGMPETTRDKVELVANMCNVEADFLMSSPAELFNRIVGYMGFLFEDIIAQAHSMITINGVNYVVQIEEELSLGEWVDIEEVQKLGNNILSNILAIVCRPIGEEYDFKNNVHRQKMYSELSVGTVLPVLAFFLKCNEALEKLTRDCMLIQEVCDLLPQNISSLQNRGDGIRLFPIWQRIKYWYLMKLLNYRLRRFLRSSNTSKTKSVQNAHSTN